MNGCGDSHAWSKNFLVETPPIPLSSSPSFITTPLPSHPHPRTSSSTLPEDLSPSCRCVWVCVGVCVCVCVCVVLWSFVHLMNRFSPKPLHNRITCMLKPTPSTLLINDRTRKPNLHPSHFLSVPLYRPIPECERAADWSPHQSPSRALHHTRALDCTTLRCAPKLLQYTSQ